MDQLNPLRNVAEKRQNAGDLPAPVLETVEVSASSKRKAERRAAKLANRNAKEAAKLADQQAKDDAKAAKALEEKERQELAELSRRASSRGRKEARHTREHPKPVSSNESPMTEMDPLYNFANEPIPRTKKELKALVLKLEDANKELRARVLENSLADPARAAGLLMAKAAQSADEIVEQASRNRDRLIQETVDTLIRTLNDIRSDLTTTIEQAGNVAADTLRNLKIR